MIRGIEACDDQLEHCNDETASFSPLQLFNPPYVPTPDDEVMRGGIAASWAGGSRGRIVIDRLLAQVPQCSCCYCAGQSDHSLALLCVESVVALMSESFAVNDAQQ
jgi:hypothetical protein